MAASSLPIVMPRWEEDLNTLLVPGEWTPARLAHLQSAIADAVAKNRDLAVQTRYNATFFIDSLEELCSNDPQTDIDYAIGGFEDSEDELVAGRKEFVFFIDGAIKRLSKSAPHTLRTLTDLKTETVRLYNELAAIMRDGRWRMMAMRARFQPSEGVGPIHGSGEPPGGAEAA